MNDATEIVIMSPEEIDSLLGCAQGLPITNLSEVNEVIHALSEMTRQIELIKIEAEQAIDLIIDQKSSRTSSIFKCMKKIREELRIFLEMKKTELFSDKKTINLNFGKVGFRESTKIKVKKDTLDRVINYNYEDAIKVKKSLNKEA
ncbi:MAG: host-nuclease inhibitor Gam family protein, partial [Candidatus Omnitrophota bacterium]